MRKYLFTIGLILICYLGIGQSNPYPIPQSIGRSNVLVSTPNYGGLQAGLIPYTFADTTAANTALTYGKTYNGFLIWTTSPPALHYRAATLNKWVQILPAGDTSGLQAWLLDGNAVTGMATEPLLGTTDSFKLNIGTNNQKRLVIPANGIVRSTSAALKYLAIDTTAGTPFGNLYYTDGGSSVNIYNSDGTLDGDRTLSGNANNYNLSFLDLHSFAVTGDDDLYFLNTQGSTTSSMVVGISNVAIASTNGGIQSNITVTPDTIFVRPSLGNLVIDTLTNASASYVLNYNPTTGLVSYAAPSGSSQWTDTTAGIYYPDFVGIGSVMNPAYPLHIIKNSSQVRIGYDGSAYTDLNVLASGTLRISSINDAVQIFRSGGSATLQVFNASGSDGVQLFGGTNTISSASGTGNIIISPGASEKVKIGSSSAPDSTLTVAGSAHITGYLKVDTDPLIYEALVTETGGVQSAIVLKNTTGTTFTLSSSDAGEIKIDADSGTPFTVNKTLVYVSMNSDGNTPPTFTYSTNYTHVDNTRVVINTFADGIITANIATNMSVKIVIYP